MSGLRVGVRLSCRAVGLPKRLPMPLRPNRFLERLGDEFPARAVVGNVSESSGAADPQGYPAITARPSCPGRHCLKRAAQVTWDDRHIAGGHDHSDPLLERPHLT